MRLTVLFIFILCLHAKAAPQTQNITLKERNISLEKALEKIRKQSGYHLVYRHEWVQHAQRINIDVKNASLETVLSACFKNQALSYEVVDKTIVIKQDTPAPVIVKTAPALQPAEPPKVKGRVLGENGEPVSGATVQIKGIANKGTITDGNGYFELQDIRNDAVLIISGVSIETQEVPVNGKDEFTITTKQRIGQMDEMLVVAYGTQKRSSFTGSAKAITSQTLAGTPRSSALESIQGNVAGVIASNGTGQPGELPSIRIRGIGSSTGAGPLYVVDGIALEGGSAVSINPNDIESMTILKDASAASLYGSRAANGVILISTKNGVNGKTMIQLSAQNGFNKATLRADQLPLNTNEMLELLREGWVNAGKDPNGFAAEMTKNAVDSTVNTDWYDALTQLGNYQQYNLSVSGGNDKTKFFVSGGHYRAKAALLGSYFNRSTVVSRISGKAGQKLSFDLNLKLSHRADNQHPDAGSNGNPVRMYKRYQPWLKIYNDDGSYDLSYSNRYNPIAVVKENSDKTNKFGVLGGFLAKYQILPFLSIENQANLDFDYRDNYSFYKSGIGTARTNGGEATYSTDRTVNFVNTSILRFQKQTEEHELGAFAGYESQQVHAQGNDIYKENFLPNTYTLDNAASNADGGSYQVDHTLNSAFLNASYSFDKRYYFTGSFRRDGSSRFGYKNRYGNFWSAGVSWNLLGEAFMKQQHVFSDLRLRSSYGANGNQSLGDYEARALYSASADYNSAPGISLSSFGNPELTWEVNKPFNVGLEFGVLRNRLRGTIEYYTRTTDGQLATLGISATNGLTGYRANIGSIKNSGLELELNSVNVKPSGAGGFSWNTSFNISTLKNKVLELERSATGEITVSKEGDDYYRYNLIAYAGVDPQTGEALWYTDKTKTATTKEYGKAGRADFGTALPKYFGGLTNNLSWKGLYLNFLIYFNFGNEVYDNWGANSNSDGSRGFSPTDAMPRYVYDHRWQHPGDITDVPKIVYLGTQTGSSSFSSSRFLYKGDYIRLRDITLGYSLPRTWMQAIHATSIQAFVRGSNLYTWTKDKRINFDPEVGVEGSVDQNLPIYKTISFGIDIKF